LEFRKEQDQKMRNNDSHPHFGRLHRLNGFKKRGISGRAKCRQTHYGAATSTIIGSPKGALPLIPPLDVFKKEDGTYIWKGVAESLLDAKAKTEELGPGEYMIFSQTSGNKIIVKSDGSPEPKAA
jgi:hypothetical protein